MNIFRTKNGEVGLISKQQFCEAIMGNTKLSVSKIRNKKINEKTTKIKDIEVMYNIGDLISFINEYPLELKSIFKKLKKKWDKNWVWDGNLIGYEEKKRKEDLDEQIRLRKVELDVIQSDILELEKEFKVQKKAKKK